jgi:hypothetical protein
VTSPILGRPLESLNFSRHDFFVFIAQVQVCF